MNRLSKGFYFGSYTVASVVGIASFVVSGLVLHESPWAAIALYCLGLLLVVYVCVTIGMLIYRMWAVIQDGHARTTPGKAVGFLFIPGFNLYWMFQAFWGFAKDYNQYVQRHWLSDSLPGPPPKLSEGLFLSRCLLILGIVVSGVSLCIYAIVVALGTVAATNGSGAPLDPASVVPVLASLGGLAIAFATLLACAWIVDLIMVWQICDGVNALKAPVDGFVNRGNRVALYCTLGEFEGNTVPLPPEGIVIGRNPAKAHLVLSSRDVSATHVHVWPERGGSGVWIQDMQSTNGTYYLDGVVGHKVNEWVRIREPKLLPCDGLFRIGENEAEFKVTAL